MLRGIAQRSLALTARLAREAPALRSATFIPRAGVLRKPVRFPVPSTICLNLHSFSTMAENQLQKRIDEINEKFVEAREELEYALEEEGTVYFEEEVELARAVAAEAVELWDKLLEDLVDDDQRHKLQRSMGMKMEQLKGESQMLFDRLTDH